MGLANRNCPACNLACLARMKGGQHGVAITRREKRFSALVKAAESESLQVITVHGQEKTVLLSFPPKPISA